MEIKTEVLDNKICTACLCVEKIPSEIENIKLKQFYSETLNEVPLFHDFVEITPLLCFDCKALLTKVVSFKEQIKDSYRILISYTKETLNECLLSDVSRPPRLKVYSTETISFTPETEVKYDYNVEIVSDIKQESVNVNDTYSDHHDDSQDDHDIDIDSEGLKVEVDEFEIHDNHNGIKCNIEKGVNNGDFLVGNLKPEIELVNLETTDVKKIRRGRPKTANNLKNTKRKQQPTKRQCTFKLRCIDVTKEQLIEEREQRMKSELYQEAVFKCVNCILAFNSEEEYLKHMENYHEQNNGGFTCAICKTILNTLDIYNKHYKRHFKRYECGLCGNRTPTRKEMQQHYKSSHSNEICRCQICEKTNNATESQPNRKSTEKSRIECPDCDKTFTHRTGLLNHKLAVHKLNNEFPCEVCKKTFRWRTSLKKHAETHERKPIPEAAAHCEDCKVSFLSVCSYKRHLKHSLRHVTKEQLKFVCDHCGRRYANKTKLRDHIEEKHLYKTYKCDICHKPSKNRVTLDQHMRNLHKGRPHDKMCHQCGKTFPTKVQLESHMRSHTGEKPFICEYCPTTFSQQSNLYKHNKQVHLNIKSKKYIPKKKDEVKAILPTSHNTSTIYLIHNSLQ